MKVASLASPGGLEKLGIQAHEPRKPAPQEVTLRVRASSLNYHDLAVVLGNIPVEDGRIPMSDGAGEVVECGEAVTDFAVGDQAMSCFFPDWPAGGPTYRAIARVPGEHIDGFAAEYVTLPATALTRMPEGYSHREAATLPCAALTAWRCLFVERPIKPGSWVLTQGTGGVSIFAIQMAKAAGARIIATSSSDEKLERVKELGADHVINYREYESWGKVAYEMTGGEGVDTVVEVGGPATLPQSIRACRTGGHIALIGILTGHKGEIPTTALFARNITLSGIMVASRQHQEDMVVGIEAMGIRPVLDKDFPLDDIADAFRHQMSQSHFGKITLSI